MLLEHFIQFGDVVEAAVIKDRQTGRSKGYGFVTFHREDDAKAAIADTNPMVHGRRANCNLAAFGKKKAKAPRREPHGRGQKNAQHRDRGWNNEINTGWAMPQYAPQVMSFFSSCVCASVFATSLSLTLTTLSWSS